MLYAKMLNYKDTVTRSQNIMMTLYHINIAYVRVTLEYSVVK